MNRETTIVAAIDLGSSKITGILGSISPLNEIEILGVEKENSAFAIRRGCVHNIEESIQKIEQIIRRLESRIALKMQSINKLYVGLGGQSVHSVRKTITRSYNSQEELTEVHLAELEYEVKQAQYDSYEVFHIIPVEYRINGVLEAKPLGAMCNRIEVLYTVIVGKSILKHNVERCLKRLNIEVAGYFVSALSQGSVLLSEEERQLGCALIDFGSSTTTLSCYKRSALQELITYPFGGNNITKDIMSLNMIESQAESAKLHHAGSLLSDGYDNDMIYIKSGVGSDGLQISQQELNRVTEARVEEILTNLQTRIREAGMEEQLTCGIVITGGASQLNGLIDSIQKRFQSRVRRAGITIKIKNSTAEPISEPIYHTAVALLAQGKENCTEKLPEPEPQVIEQPESTTQKVESGGKADAKGNNKNGNKSSGGNKLGSLLDLIFGENDKSFQQE